MAKKNVVFTTSASGQNDVYWIAVDDTDIPLNNGTGTIALDDGVEHYLIWWMKGNPGDKLTIEGKVGSKSVVKVKESTAGSKGTVAGTKKFNI